MEKKRKKRRANGEGSVYYNKKTGRWMAQLVVGYDGKTGRLLMRAKSSATQAEALENLAALKERYLHTAAVLADKMTAGQWLDKWFATYSRPRLRVTTAERYAFMIGVAKEYIGKRRLGKVAEFDLQNIINQRFADNYERARYFRVVMRMAFGRAAKLKMIPVNIADDLLLPRKPHKKPFVRPTKEQRDALLRAKTPFFCWREILLTEFMTGLRRGELLALHWRDINLAEGWLEVHHSLVNADGKVMLTDPKTEQSRRRIYIPQALCQELRDYRHLQGIARLESGHWEHPDLVFTYKDGQYISPAYFSSYYARVRKRLGIETTFHMLRHDLASRMKDSKKFDLKDIQEQLGHSHINVTMDIYTHLNEESRADVGRWMQEDMGNVIPIDEKRQQREMK